ncbi:MAG: hypothetical protein ACOC1T_02190 [Halorhodospira sp.]
MNIAQFVEARPYHPLADALGFMESSKEAEEYKIWQAFCQGAVYMMKHYGELTEEQAATLKDDINGNGGALQ